MSWPRRYSIDQEVRMLGLWIGGRTHKAIAKVMGVKHRSRMADALHKRGVPNRKTGARQHNLWPAIVSWARAGFTAEEIADGIGLKGRARMLMITPYPAETNGHGRNERGARKAVPRSRGIKPARPRAGSARQLRLRARQSA